ncbi:cellulose biosynthesis cyclic di-GMP-binding regulatory protein BcsB [Caloramator sp. mosi_1]|uniref:cellulose biosynthesis cyclic di-GMP-binding regulatory protein BcsB n=1 Tax=Caloramator sp. mosi_1 TaxID=3023090 RepID=UPI00235FBF52|nr:cellulose biosynthesis cyclic di-GMP-binding regulatory protein BcsB [Caloramator sp. mosi_1]WDC85186.1 cellulose biosynthesis cyclic di-GMP-binding regulatory protein BcsB [Caloramator sp. mosi_1]
MKRVLIVFTIFFILCSQPIYAEEIGVRNYKLNNNIELRGIRASFNFNFYVDEHWILKDEGYVYLNVNISDVIKYKNSMLTVYLNGFPVGSIDIYGKKIYKQPFT